MTRQVTVVPVLRARHGARSPAAMPGCLSCGWSGLPGEDERFHLCPVPPLGPAAPRASCVAVRHGRAWVLLSRRSPHVQHGGTWSCSGGAADEGETPWQAAVREASEEISGIDVNPAGIAGEHVWECPAQCGWSYTTFVVAVPLRAGRLPRVRVAAGAHAWETDELAWVPASRVHARDLHHVR